ncbi:hypothetical protein [Photorhabdus luminescens]|uniref:Uncharacterized protein n=1 Tax=Photorhabdus luminescens subsp. mexicana TaxID=2100167 RepID=A0A4R4IX94_PHOLU|nr:hypothetical protein [Photorhabdus luminescens]TDB45312.1 hypothetical protein C5468_21280 [Photorhabdus luminescens subsp. mexicana]
MLFIESVYLVLPGDLPAIRHIQGSQKGTIQTVEGLKLIVAQLLEDAHRRQKLAPNTSTENRIADAVAVLGE